MPTSGGGQVLATARPSTSQAPSSNLRSESSAARCRVFRKRDQKKLKAKNQAQLENAQLRCSLNFKYSARSPVSTPANNTAGPTVPSAWVYPGGCLVYLRFLQRRIKKISLYVDVFQYDLERKIKWLLRRIDSESGNLKNRVKTMKCNRVRGNDLVKGLQRLHAKIDLYKRRSKDRMDLLHFRKRVYDDDVRRKIQRLNSKLARFPQGLDTQGKLLEIKITSNTHNFNQKVEGVTSRYLSFFKMFSDDFMAVDI